IREQKRQYLLINGNIVSGSSSAGASSPGGNPSPKEYFLENRNVVSGRACVWPRRGGERHCLRSAVRRLRRKPASRDDRPGEPWCATDRQSLPPWRRRVH